MLLSPVGECKSRIGPPWIRVPKCARNKCDTLGKELPLPGSAFITRRFIIEFARGLKRFARTASISNASVESCDPSDMAYHDRSFYTHEEEAKERKLFWKTARKVLTKRSLEILKLKMKGEHRDEIGEKFGIHPRSVHESIRQSTRKIKEELGLAEPRRRKRIDGKLVWYTLKDGE